MTDQNRKTLRSFYCLDALWSLFDQQTHEFGVSMDYLINESMRQYAESQGFGLGPQGFGPANASQPPQQMSQPLGTGAPQGRHSAGFPRASAPNMSGPGGPAMGHPAARNHPAGMPPGGNMGPPGGSPMNPAMNELGNVTLVPNMSPNPSMRGFPPGANAQGPRHGAPAKHMPGRNHPNATGGQPAINSPNFVNPTFQNFDPPPPPRQPEGFGPQNNPWNPSQRPSGFGNQMQAPPQPPRPQSQGGIPPLYLYFDNNRYTIGAEDFVIGRGSQRTDLTIRDGNISRRHCAILYRNGSHYIKDLGSTNGVEFQGNRIESKKISEGDIYYLCDYELRFSYQ